MATKDIYVTRLYSEGSQHAELPQIFAHICLKIDMQHEEAKHRGNTRQDIKKNHEHVDGAGGDLGIQNRIRYNTVVIKKRRDSVLQPFALLLCSFRHQFDVERSLRAHPPESVSICTVVPVRKYFRTSKAGISARLT